MEQRQIANPMHLSQEATQGLNASEFGYFTRLVPSSSQSIWKGRSKSKFATKVLKLAFIIVTSVLVLTFQMNRPKVTHTYTTGYPWDTMHHGKNYTCRCNPNSKAPQNSSDPSSFNICYDSSLLETVNILMYKSFKDMDKLESVLQDAYPNDFSDRKKSIPTMGFKVEQQGHYITYHNESILNSFSELFLNGATEQRQFPMVNYVQGESFYEFPSAFVATTLAYNCTNCITCSIASVRSLFNGLGLPNQPWGNCQFWGHGVRDCRTINSYMGKCVMYPTAAIPLIFAIQAFLKKLLKLPGVAKVTPGNEQDLFRNNTISFDANLVYMNFSNVRSNQEIQLNFFEIERTSAWFQLLGSFPTIDRQCADLPNVTITHGTSLCNLFKSSQDSTYAVKCHDMSNKNECLCDLQFINNSAQHISVDYSSTLQHEFGVSGWQNVMCMNYTARSVYPYTVLWQTDPSVANDAFNWLLESKILADQWHQQSGVCTTMHQNVVRKVYNGATIFLETRCSESQNSTGSQPAAGFCWLTGRYKNWTDIPTPMNMYHHFTSAPSKDLFLCSNEASQKFTFSTLLCLLESFLVGLGQLTCSLHGSLSPLFLNVSNHSKSGGVSKSQSLKKLQGLKFLEAIR